MSESEFSQQVEFSLNELHNTFKTDLELHQFVRQ